jgi:hypothetical protein
MKTASLKEIKTELQLSHNDRLIELCMHLAKFRKENKELLNYLLFESDDEQTYIEEVKTEMDELFEGVNVRNSFYAKKTIRKILRLTNKYVKYSGSKLTEIELWIHFCKKLKQLGVPLAVNTVLGNIYKRQFHKIHTSMAYLHEDLQFDYSEQIRLL